MTSQQPRSSVPAAGIGLTERWRVAGLCVALAVITCAVFGQTLRFDFINFDDYSYVQDNPVVGQGVTLHGLGWAFNNFHAGNWHPLTWLSHMLDCQIYGLNPGGHHLTNVLIHSATVIVLFLVLREMTGTLWRSAFVAAVFAIHPLRAESVAWVAERKDVLSGLFFVLTVGMYLRYVRILRSGMRYVLVLLLFVLGLMSKPMLVTLPFVLLLLDHWPLRRAESDGKLVLEKLPLLALTVVGCVVTLLAQKTEISEHLSIPASLRVENALVASIIYIRQMVWPAGLSAFYPFPRNGLPLWEVVLAAMALAGVSIIAWVERRKQPWLLVGWLWYLVMLLPVVGIVQVGGQSHADRYTYLPQIGIYIAITWLVAQWRVSRLILGVLMPGVLAVLMVCAWKQTAYWRDSQTLWVRAIDCDADNELAHGNLGMALLQKGQVDEAIIQFQRALQINPNSVRPHYSLGSALMQQGRTDEAISQFQRALEIAPNYAEVHDRLGSALLREGKTDEAISHFQRALQIDPEDAQAHYNLANVLLQKLAVNDAISHYQKALQINPSYAEAHVNLGNALFQKGDLDEAILHYQRALQIDPDLAPAHVNLGDIFLQRGNLDDAILHLKKAAQINPGLAEAHASLGDALRQKGRIAEAIPQYEQAAQLESNDPTVLNNLAWLLATCPAPSMHNSAKAVQLAQRANEITGAKNPFVLRTLAAAFAGNGQFNDARQSAQKAIALARKSGRRDLAEQLTADLKNYEAGLPCHQ